MGSNGHRYGSVIQGDKTRGKTTGPRALAVFSGWFVVREMPGSGLGWAAGTQVQRPFIGWAGCFAGNQRGGGRHQRWQYRHGPEQGGAVVKQRAVAAGVERLVGAGMVMGARVVGHAHRMFGALDGAR